MTKWTSEVEETASWGYNDSGLLEWQLAAIEEGIKDEEEDHLVPHEVVMAKWRMRLEDQMEQSGQS